MAGPLDCSPLAGCLLTDSVTPVLPSMLAIVAVDGSAESEAAVQFVHSNCIPEGGQLLVLLCRPQQATAYSDAGMPPASPVCSTMHAAKLPAACRPPVQPAQEGWQCAQNICSHGASCVQGEASGQALRQRFPQAQVDSCSLFANAVYVL